MHWTIATHVHMHILQHCTNEGGASFFLFFLTYRSQPFFLSCSFKFQHGNCRHPMMDVIVQCSLYRKKLTAPHNPYHEQTHPNTVSHTCMPTTLQRLHQGHLHPYYTPGQLHHSTPLVNCTIGQLHHTTPLVNCTHTTHTHTRMRLSTVAEEEGLIAEEQGGFQKMRGCRDQALSLVLLGQMEMLKKSSGLMVACRDQVLSCYWVRWRC